MGIYIVNVCCIYIYQLLIVFCSFCVFKHFLVFEFSFLPKYNYYFMKQDEWQIRIFHSNLLAYMLRPTPEYIIFVSLLF